MRPRADTWTALRQYEVSLTYKWFFEMLLQCHPMAGGYGEPTYEHPPFERDGSLRDGNWMQPYLIALWYWSTKAVSTAF